MVDVSGKELSLRTAEASCVIQCPSRIVEAIFDPRIKINLKGDIIGCAKIAGIMAAKKTHELVPMCHQIPLNSVNIEIDRRSHDCIGIRGITRAFYRTGVEMEALTAVSVAALTVYDMTKSALKGTGDKIIIREIKLDSKEVETSDSDRYS